MRTFGCLILLFIIIAGGGAFVWLDPLDLGIRETIEQIINPNPVPTEVVQVTPGGVATTPAPADATATDTQPPPSATPTPQPRREPLEIVSVDFCRVPFNAATDFSAQSVESLRGPHILSNGREFPGNAPRDVELPQGPPREEVLVRFTPDSSTGERNAFIGRIGGAREQIDELNTVLVTLRPNITIEDVPDSPIVVSVEPNYVLGVAQISTTAADPRLVDQWAFPVVGLPTAWADLQPNQEQVTVAVIDSGICAGHPDLQGRVLPGFDFVERDDNPQDEYGHGCQVAGVIAANANNIGIAGVAPHVQIMPLRVLDDRGLGGYSRISEAVIYAADNGADIINMSLAGPFYSQILDDAVRYALDKGVTIIGAAGNGGLEGAWYPAALPGVIGVGSVDPGLARSAFSNFGTNVDLYAPGSDILTTSTSGDYELTSGTSLAAPIVSGLAALSLAYNQPLYTSNTIIRAYPPSNAPVC